MSYYGRLRPGFDPGRSGYRRGRDRRRPAFVPGRDAMPGGPTVEPVCCDGSYGFRPKRGTWHLLADLEANVADGGLYTLAVDDVRKAFDNVVIVDLTEDLREYIRDEGLLTLIEAVVRGGDDE